MVFVSLLQGESWNWGLSVHRKALALSSLLEACIKSISRKVCSLGFSVTPYPVQLFTAYPRIWRSCLEWRDKQKGFVGGEKNRSRRRKLCSERTAALCCAPCFVISPRTFLLQSTKTLLTPILLGQFPGLDFTFQWHLVTLEVFHLEVVLLALALALFSISVDSVKSSLIFSHPPSFPQPPTLTHTDIETHTQRGGEIERERQRSSQGTSFCFLLWCQNRKGKSVYKQKTQEIAEVENVQRLLDCFGKCI